MTLFKIEWQTNKKNIMIWSLTLSVVVFFFMSLFPSMMNPEMTEMMTTKLDSLPENILKAFHLNSGPSLAEPTGFFAYVFQYVFIAASMYAVMLGSKMLLKEETEGTIEFLYAQPVSRAKIFFEKLGASLSLVGLMWLVVSGVSLGATLFFRNDMSTQGEIVSGLSKILVMEFLVLLFFLSLGFLLSSMMKQNNIGLSMGIVFLFYLLGIVGDLKEEFKVLSDLSPMSQGNPATILDKGISPMYVLSLVVVGIIFLGVSLLTYRKKDLEV